MANPNRTAYHWRNSNPTFERVADHRASSQIEADSMAEEIRATGQYAKVVSGSYAIGPRNRNQRVFYVRCYNRIEA